MSGVARGAPPSDPPSPFLLQDYPRTLWTVADGEQMSTGTEEIEPGSEIPWHAHPDAEEVLVCIKGAG